MFSSRQICKLVETGEDREWVFVGYGFDHLVILK